MDDALRERVDALERAVTDGDCELTELTAEADALERLDDLESEIEELDDRVAELEAATQALRGYVGNIRSVNRDVEQRADAALAKAQTIEATLGGDSQMETAKEAPQTDEASAEPQTETASGERAQPGSHETGPATGTAADEQPADGQQNHQQAARENVERCHACGQTHGTWQTDESQDRIESGQQDMGHDQSKREHSQQSDRQDPTQRREQTAASRRNGNPERSHNQSETAHSQPEAGTQWEFDGKQAGNHNKTHNGQPVNAEEEFPTDTEETGTLQRVREML